MERVRVWPHHVEPTAAARRSTSQMTEKCCTGNLVAHFSEDGKAL
jgi:hypothetical protein